MAAPHAGHFTVAEAPPSLNFSLPQAEQTNLALTLVSDSDSEPQQPQSQSALWLSWGILITSHFLI
jgi:hypothetical protein